jgi:phenylalanyl-tRNA synthetase alpha chain
MADREQDLRAKVRELREEFEKLLPDAEDLAALQALQDRFLGRKSGAVTALMKGLGQLTQDAKREMGQALNGLKNDLTARLDEARTGIETRAQRQSLARDRVDVTLPGRKPPRGRRHPLTVTRQELENVFIAMGYEVYEGPEVDDDFHCFEALNMPPDHPARDMQDTFYLKGTKDLLLRTHTSTAQIRYMLENSHPPHVRIICPGKVYRRDSDITHSPMFQQIEGLVVGTGITLGHLKGTIQAFLKPLFGADRAVRFRPSYFPYTEPSVETDLGCAVCGGSGTLPSGEGCRVCKQTGWVEILGSGMMNPAVFEAVNARLGRTVYDPEQVTGFAFGLGIERVAMMRHGIDDIRLFYGDDLRFLEQFRG